MSIQNKVLDGCLGGVGSITGEDPPPDVGYYVWGFLRRKNRVMSFRDSRWSRGLFEHSIRHRRQRLRSVKLRGRLVRMMGGFSTTRTLVRFYLKDVCLETESQTKGPLN